jgi:hypothetical protein
MALSIVQAQYHIYHTDLSGYLAGADMVQDALTRFALGGKFTCFFQFTVFLFVFMWLSWFLACLLFFLMGMGDNRTIDE